MNTTSTSESTPRNENSVSEESNVTPEAPAADSQKPAQEPNPVRRFSLIILVILAVLFAWYIAADRVAPWTDQARVNTFVIPITPKVSGKVKSVHVSQDQQIQAGDLLVVIDSKEYEFAVQRAEAILELAEQDTGAETAGVTAAESKVAEARALLRKAKLDATRVERIYKMEPGAVSADTREETHTAVDLAQAQVANLVAELERAKQRLGKSGGDNARVREALAALEQARLDLSWTKLYAPYTGGITNLKIDKGYYAKAGVPLMTFTSFTDVWVEAYLRENSVGNIEIGDPVDIVLDMVPGRVFKGSVTSKSFAVKTPSSGEAGQAVTVKSGGGWLRDAQRFPVFIRFNDESAYGSRFAGGQADVQIYTRKSNAILNGMGRLWIRLMSWLTYAY